MYSDDDVDDESAAIINADRGATADGSQSMCGSRAVCESPKPIIDWPKPTGNPYARRIRSAYRKKAPPPAKGQRSKVNYSGKILRSVIMCQNIALHFVYGNLKDSEDRTVVNSTGDYIDLSVSVGKSLAGKAGPRLREACEKLTPLRAGQVAATHGFNMSCEQILHCNCHHWNQIRNKSELQKILVVCMRMAGSKEHRTIAFPAVGMGIKSYPSSEVIGAIVEATATYSEENPKSSLRKANLYIYDREFSFEQLRSFSDVLLTRYKHRFSCPGMIEVEGVKIAVHIGTPQDTEALQDIITNSLLWSGGIGAKFVAFPAIDTTKLDYPPERVAKCFEKASSTFAIHNPRSGIEKTVMIVDHDNSAMIKGFRKSLNWTLTEYEPDEKDMNSHPPGDRNPIETPRPPSAWEKPTQKHRQVTLDRKSLEFERVDFQFRKTPDRAKETYRIIEITRVQNFKSHQLYHQQRTIVARKLCRSEDEVESAPLWHGTAEVNIASIVKSGFDRIKVDSEGSLGKNCSYFATRSAAAEAFAPGDLSGARHIIMARVVTGEYCHGNPDHKQAPYKPFSCEQYDSVVDDELLPTEYAVFHDTSSYPEYIIKYRDIRPRTLSD